MQHTARKTIEEVSMDDLADRLERLTVLESVDLGDTLIHNAKDIDGAQVVVVNTAGGRSVIIA